MKYGNSLIIFIYLLLADLFLYSAASLYPATFLGPYTDLAFTLIFSLSLLGFFLSSFDQQKNDSRFYYYFLWIVSLIFVFLYIFETKALANIAKYYFVLAVLIALLLAILDYKRYTAGKIRLERLRRLQDKQKYQGMINYQKRNLSELRDYSHTLKELNEEYKIANENKNTEIGSAQRELMQIKREASMISDQIKKGQLSIEELDRKTLQLKDKSAKIEEAKANLAHIERQNLLLRKELSKKAAELREKEALHGRYLSTLKQVADSKKAVKELEQDNTKLKRVVSKVESEAQKQEELKQKYSKTLLNMKNAKRDLEELLVVSPDGGSVHRPTCIAVRNIPKESRKLIKNWKEAIKQGYKGCKLCSPDKKYKDNVLMKGSTKYRYIGSKGSDKFHKISCSLVKRIHPADKLYFKSYKQALNKGYTECRVCDPKQ
jgi:myosin heavy subunit